MNIALLTTEYAHKKTPRTGGIGTFFKLLAKELHKKGNNVTVVVFTGKKDFDFNDEGVCVYVRKDFFKKNKLIDLIRSLTKKSTSYKKIYKQTYIKERKYIAKEFNRIVRYKNIEVVETQDYGGISLFLDEKYPILIRCHGTNKVLTREFNYNKTKLYNQVFDELEDLTINNLNNTIVGVSKYSSSLIEKMFLRKNVNYIYNGVDIKKFKISDEKIIENAIFYFGTLSEKKGLITLCNIFNNIKTKLPNASLHLIGKGANYFQYLKREVLDSSVLEDVFYYNELDNKDLPSLLGKANVVLFPTKGENFPFVFLEAMALKKIIIVSNIKPSLEIIENNKNGFIAHSEADFIEKTLYVLTNYNKLTVIEEKARQTIEDKFTSEVMADLSIKLYQKIIKEYNEIY